MNDKPVAIARIMVVEDEAITAHDIRISLERLGYEVPVVLSRGDDAIRITDEIKPDLILMDITLDGSMTGIEAAKQIRAAHRIPIIFLTAHRDDITLESAISTEPFAYLTKPWNLNRLKITIEVTLYKSAADARVRESEERYRTLMEQAPIAITVLSGGNFCYCNPAAERLFGATNDKELIDRSILEAVHPDSREEIWEWIATVLATGIRAALPEEKLVRLDGAAIICEIVGIPSTYKGKPALQVVFCDITAQKRAEVGLKKALDDLETQVEERTADLNRSVELTKRISLELVWAEERERERIAGELHDRVGQSLLLAKMKLKAIANRTTEYQFREAANEVASLLETSILDIRTLTFSVRPPILNTAGIGTALEWLCSSMRNDYPLKIDFIDDHHPKPLSAEVRYYVYQAVRELLLNVAKHAGAENVQVTVNAVNGSLVVQVIDNGAGFHLPATGTGESVGTGYGLYNVEQRIELISGSFDIQSVPGRGTTATVTVPLEGG